MGWCIKGVVFVSALKNKCQKVLREANVIKLQNTLEKMRFFGFKRYVNQIHCYTLNPVKPGLYENLLSLGGGHMAPLPENLRNMSGGPETWFGI